MKSIKVCIVLAASMIVGSTVWSGCYTRLAIGSDDIAPEAALDTTAINQIATLNEVAQSVFFNDPWVIAPFAPFYFRSSFAETHFHNNGVASTYRPLPFTGTPSVNSAAESQPPSPHRQSGYQRSSPPDQNNSRIAEPVPARTTQNPAPASSTTRTPTPSATTTGAPATGAPPANNRGGGATRGGR